MSFKWEEPMNPFAKEDFANAVKEATSKLSDDLKKLGEQMKENFPFMDDPYIAFEAMDEDYCGTMRLDLTSEWHSVMVTLLENGYEVTMRYEDATEVEREVDGADKFIVIEYGEVE